MPAEWLGLSRGHGRAATGGEAADAFSARAPAEPENRAGQQGWRRARQGPPRDHAAATPGRAATTQNTPDDGNAQARRPSRRGPPVASAAPSSAPAAPTCWWRPASTHSARRRRSGAESQAASPATAPVAAVTAAVPIRLDSISDRRRQPHAAGDEGADEVAQVVAGGQPARPASCAIAPSRTISGSIGVNAKRPMPMATASALIATKHVAATDRRGSGVATSVAMHRFWCAAGACTNELF